ncbi:hypothetical protein DL93DRAFT_2158548 [Clavulina sp. PMI_390]|nr:hypothetical protein DL93DRAFT_2158548 [Clavulina sp. PMI_390]
MAAAQFYFIVSPDPVTRAPPSDATGPHYFVKFGDNAVGGLTAGQRYSSNNPSYHMVFNQNIQGGSAYRIPNSTEQRTAIGRFVQKYVLGRTPFGAMFGTLNLTEIDTADEWYIIRPGPGGVAALRTWLTNFLTGAGAVPAAFATLNFNAAGANTAEQEAWARTRELYTMMGPGGGVVVGQGFN